MKVAKINM